MAAGPSFCATRALLAAAAAVLASPTAARGEPTLLDATLRAPSPDVTAPPTLPAHLRPAVGPLLARLAEPERPAEGEDAPAGGEAKPEEGAEKPGEGEAKPAPPPPLDFDLLGEAKPPAEGPDAERMRRRRSMLRLHQGIGLGLLGLQVATTAVGQLNYSDKYAGGPQTDQYRLAHKTLAYTTFAVFATNGLIALLAPSPGTPKKLDRVMVHRIAMLVATAGMVTQVGLGVYTRERVGYEDQERLATAHLAVGYVTLAAMLVGVGALIF
jgi:hypothetical protein